MQFCQRGDKCNLVGFVDYGEFNSLHKLTRTEDGQLATDILQLTFNGLTGFRWPIAYFATKKANPTMLYNTFWRAVDLLQEYDFHVLYCSLDGATTNRGFMHMHFDNSIERNLFTTANIYDLTKSIFFIQDIKHCLKKIRNNIASSNVENANRQLLLNAKSILWDHWVEAYNYNLNFGFRLHPKLTKDHIELSGAAKMRNGLANQVLDANMLVLMNAYQKSLPLTSRDTLDSSIKLLENTSVLVDIFHDYKRPITGVNDDRVQQLDKVLKFFQAWQTEILSSNATTKVKNSRLITKETREDIESCLTGFIELVKYVAKLGMALVPGFINSDPVENFFCQQRGIRNGLATNPKVSQYGAGVNAIIIGQQAVSRKSNTGDRTITYKGTKPNARKRPTENKQLPCSPKVNRI